MRLILIAIVSVLIAAAALIAAWAAVAQRPRGDQSEPRYQQTEAGAAAQEQPSATPAKEPTPAAAAQGPNRTTETFGDWSVVCAATGATPARNCTVETSIMAQGQSAPFARIALLWPAKDKPVELIAVVPVNIAPASPVKITAAKTVFTLPFRSCVPGGCLAVAELSQQDLQILGTPSKSPGQLALVDASGRSATPQFSMQGLNDALGAYLKRQE